MFNMFAFSSFELREPNQLLILLRSLFFCSAYSLIFHVLTEHCSHRVFVCAQAAQARHINYRVF